MKNAKILILALAPAYLLLTACGAHAPDPHALPQHSSAPATTSSNQVAAQKPGTPSVASTPVSTDKATLEAKQSDLKTQQTNLLAKQSELNSQKQGFANPAAMSPAKFGDVMAGANALPAAIDQAKIDAVITAAQNADLDALQKAVDDLLADLQKQLDDLQKQIQDLADQIAAAKA